jgi:hypothetical protein
MDKGELFDIVVYVGLFGLLVLAATCLHAYVSVGV